jgi:hypothetical protein
MVEDWSRIAALTAIHDQSHADVERAIAAIEHLEPGITPDNLKCFASAAHYAKDRFAPMAVICEKSAFEPSRTLPSFRRISCRRTDQACFRPAASMY